MSNVPFLRAHDVRVQRLFNVGDEGRGGTVRRPYVSANLFKLIGVKPAIGRDFDPEDDRPGDRPVSAPLAAAVDTSFWPARRATRLIRSSRSETNEPQRGYQFVAADCRRGTESPG